MILSNVKIWLFALVMLFGCFAVPAAHAQTCEDLFSKRRSLSEPIITSLFDSKGNRVSLKSAASDYADFLLATINTFGKQTTESMSRYERDERFESLIRRVTSHVSESLEFQIREELIKRHAVLRLQDKLSRRARIAIDFVLISVVASPGIYALGYGSVADIGHLMNTAYPVLVTASATAAGLNALPVPFQKNVAKQSLQLTEEFQQELLQQLLAKISAYNGSESDRPVFSSRNTKIENIAVAMKLARTVAEQQTPSTP